MGRGLSFPVRPDYSTGKLRMSNGFYGEVSVALAYISEKWTLRGDVEETTNHIAESIYNILFTREAEHESIPWYGSRISYSIFEPNTAEFKLLFSAYLRWASERWEKRARFPEKGSIAWLDTGVLTDKGELPVHASLEFITQQTPKNLVLPFVTIRQARLQEYPSSVVDNNGHDLASRHYNKPSYSDGNYRYLRVTKNIDIPPASDDSFYTVKPGDTWMLIAYSERTEIRYWYYIYLCYIQDRAKKGATRDILNPDREPEAGEVLRIPSKQRLLLISSRR